MKVKTTVKSVETDRYVVALVEGSSGLYYVVYNTMDLDEPVITEGMKDYTNASFVFDQKLLELEGH